MRLLSAEWVAVFAIMLGGAAVARSDDVDPAKVIAPVPDPAAARHDLTHQDLEAWLDGYLPYALQRGDVAGAAVVVVKDGAVLLRKGYGYADVAARKPFDPEQTLLRPGSTSKLFTWTAVMQQVEKGRLDLDVDVNRYLDFKIPPRDGLPVTLRNLMTHTGGFEETLKGAYTFNPDDLPSLDTYIKGWIPTRVFPPGEVPAYSNYGTALAGYIVERVSGEPFETYIERHIFEPLNMKSSTFRQPLPPQLLPRMSKGYVTASGPPRPYELYGYSPAGSSATTAEDMSHFMICHLQNGSYGTATILRPETARMMHETALTVLPAVNRMLLGFYETNRNGHRIIAHAGDTPLFHSVMHLYLDDGVGLFISMNSPGRDGAEAAIISALFEEFTDRYMPGPAPEGSVSPARAAADAALIAGEYVSSRGSRSNFLSVLGLLGSTQVTAAPDATLRVTNADGINGQPKVWREIAPLVWGEVGGKDRLAARVKEGRVVMFSYDEISPFIVFLPVSAWRSPALLMPLLQLALTAFALTAVQWPVAAFVRRRYRARFALAGRDAWAYRSVRVTAFAVFAVLAAWLWTFMGFIQTTLPMTAKTDGWLLFLHLMTTVVFVGSLGIAIWSAVLTWRGKRGWLARVWSLVLVAAAATVVWIGLICHLIGAGTNY
jgi:CubicO group peptidase (beta-lactamase class C family)